MQVVCCARKIRFSSRLHGLRRGFGLTDGTSLGLDDLMTGGRNRRIANVFVGCKVVGGRFSIYDPLLFPSSTSCSVECMMYDNAPGSIMNGHILHVPGFQFCIVSTCPR